MGYKDYSRSSLRPSQETNAVLHMSRIKFNQLPAYVKTASDPMENEINSSDKHIVLTRFLIET